MRVSTAQQYESYLGNIRDAQSKYFEAQQQVMTGKRINQLSDDPFGGSFVLKASSLKSATQQYDTNLNSAKNYLGFSESALNDMHDLMNRAYQLSVSAANSATTQFSRQAMVSEITEIQRKLIDLGNTKGANGQYIFAGQKSDTMPFSASPPTLNYNGDNGNINIETGPGETLAVNSQLGAMVTTAYANLESFKTHLTGGDLGAMSGVDIPQLQSSLNAIDVERGNIGAKLQTVDALKNHNQRRIDDLTTRISDVEEVDMADAVSHYQLAQTAYSAALQVASTGYKLSLMDYLRG